MGMASGTRSTNTDMYMYLTYSNDIMPRLLDSSASQGKLNPAVKWIRWRTQRDREIPILFDSIQKSLR